MGDFHEAVLFIKPMCAQKLLGRSKQYFGNASFASVRNERCKQFACSTEFGTAISLGDKHFPQSSLTLPYILEGYGANDVTIGFGYPKFAASLTIEPSTSRISGWSSALIGMSNSHCCIGRITAKTLSVLPVWNVLILIKSALLVIVLPFISPANLH